MDSSTPQGAILFLEDAYRKKDIEAVVVAKDFITEARLMLECIRREKNEGLVDPELIPKTARVLELSFRDYYRRNGFPDMSSGVSTFTRINRMKMELSWSLKSALGLMAIPLLRGFLSLRRRAYGRS